MNLALHTEPGNNCIAECYSCEKYWTFLMGKIGKEIRTNED